MHYWLTLPILLSLALPCWSVHKVRVLIIRSSRNYNKWRASFPRGIKRNYKTILNNRESTFCFPLCVLRLNKNWALYTDRTVFQTIKILCDDFHQNWIWTKRASAGQSLQDDCNLLAHCEAPRLRRCLCWYETPLIRASCWMMDANTHQLIFRHHMALTCHPLYLIGNSA